MSMVAWAISGGGHFLREIVPLVHSLAEVDIFFSRAACEVVPMYGCEKDLLSKASRVVKERDHSSFASCGFARGAYDLLVVAPATSNTVAKCVLGIGDTLVTNLFAQGGKFRVPTVVLPTDVAEEITSLSISHRPLSIRPRPVDLAHTEALKDFPGVTLVKSPEELALFFKEKGFVE